MSDAVTLDPHAPLPLYAQLYRILRRRILEGVYAEGEAIPSENGLRDVHGITRGTVRKAITLLAGEGLVRQSRGRGTIVTCAPINNSVWNFGGFTDFSRARGQKPLTRLISRTVEEGAEGPVLRLVRARGIATDAAPTFLNLDTSWLSLQRYPRLETFDFERLSLYHVLRDRYGTVPVRSELTLSVSPHSELTAGIFGDAAGVAGFLCAAGDVFCAEDRLVERTSVVYSPKLDMRLATSWNSPAAGAATTG